MSFQAVKLHHHCHVGARPCSLYPSSLEHNSNCALSLHRTFDIMLVVLKGNLNSKRAVLSVFPTTSCFIIPLLDVVAKRLHLHEISRQMCRDHHQHSELFQGIDQMHDEKCHPCPLMICEIINNLIASPPTQTCSCFVLSLKFLAIQLILSSTLEYYHLYIKNVVSIITPLKNS